MKLINCTPHPINVYDEMGENVIMTIPVSDLPAIRLSEITEDIGEINGVKTLRKQFSDAENLPEEIDGVLYIVSILIMNNCDRSDFISPDTGKMYGVRDENGNILGTKRFIVK